MQSRSSQILLTSRNQYSSSRLLEEKISVFVDGSTPEMLLMQWGKKGGGKRGSRNTADQSRFT